MSHQCIDVLCHEVSDEDVCFVFGECLLEFVESLYLGRFEILGEVTMSMIITLFF